jgi:hypothetical protein
MSRLAAQPDDLPIWEPGLRRKTTPNVNLSQVGYWCVQARLSTVSGGPYAIDKSALVCLGACRRNRLLSRRT